MKDLSLLVLSDSITRHTGFSRVMRNLLMGFSAQGCFKSIVQWGIGYDGKPHDFPSVKIWPAAPRGGGWERMDNLKEFAALARRSEPTHVLLLQDLWGIMPLSNLMQEMTEAGVETACYFPVDAPVDPIWTRIVASVKHPVAYTEYGRREVARALSEPEYHKPIGPVGLWNRIQARRAAAVNRLKIIPHGVDEVFKVRISEGARERAKRNFFGKRVGKNDLLIVGVSTNTRRKGLLQSMQILAELRGLRGCERIDASAPGLFKFLRFFENGQELPPSPRWKLYLHTPAENPHEHTNLGVAAKQLGLTPGVDVFFGSEHFEGDAPTLPDEILRTIYGAADLFLTTSCGEGWCLPLTEAMACGTPVAGPGHTSIRELLAAGERGLMLPVLPQEDIVPGDCSRIRPRVDARQAAFAIYKYMQSEERSKRAARARAWAKALRWDGIADKWLDLFGIN